MKQKLTKKIMLTAIALNQVLLTTSYAATDTSQIDAVFTWILDWTQKIGIGVIIWGAISIGLAYKNEDSHAMEKGLKMLVSGFMLASIDLLVSQFM